MTLPSRVRLMVGSLCLAVIVVVVVAGYAIGANLEETGVLNARRLRQIIVEVFL